MSEQAVILGDLGSQDGAQLKMVLIIAEPEADSSVFITDSSVFLLP